MRQKQLIRLINIIKDVRRFLPSINSDLRNSSCIPISRYVHDTHSPHSHTASARGNFCTMCGTDTPPFSSKLKVRLRKQENFMSHYKCYSFWGASKSNDWNKAVSNAEKIVGYPTSFMSLRCLLSDELSNVAMHMRKLVGTKHPIMATARGMVYDGKHNLQTRGLIVLLISKAAGLSHDVASDGLSEKDIISGILPSQRQLAEVTEMIYTAHLIHNGVVNIAMLKENNKNTLKDLEFGNKMAVLSGDFLLANASTGLAELNNTKVVEMISSAIGDSVLAEFSGLTDDEGKTRFKHDITFDEWEKQTYLSTGSLLAKSCMSAMELANQPEHIQEKAFLFGKNLAFARQLNEELKPYVSSVSDPDQLSLTSGPITKFLLTNKDSNLAEAAEKRDVKKIVSLVKNSNAVETCRTVMHHYRDISLHSLEGFEESEAKSALLNIVDAATKS